MNDSPRLVPELAFERPRLRGVLHQWAFFVSVVLGALLVVLAPAGEARTATLIYAAAVCGLFGVSALYHRVTWRPAVRRWMRRLDHSMIFILIAATYTPFGMLVLEGTLAVVVLAIVWGGALAGVLLKLVWIDAPKWLVATAYVALGWVAAIAMPELGSRLGLGALALLIGGGTAYTAGAVIYARQRPDPAPTVFGYHEIFHLLVIVAAAAHFAAVAFFVLPGA
ncbi:MAG TPA: hemolysin III family protein [Thermoleophilaceae bacterium]|nr:hemolysin III family protein [Thermoleophilaceae bacterium]